MLAKWNPAAWREYLAVRDAHRAPTITYVGTPVPRVTYYRPRRARRYAWARRAA